MSSIGFYKDKFFSFLYSLMIFEKQFLGYKKTGYP
ncbi:hypothetical protein NSB1T_09655 [Coprobacter fastidiosus NSB1 = JCM 33896]|nr:hypothetical protein NSB1T_09655 [Coprobacter fastidiosus NSB1 = JCM 33896]